jgi:hypothetical protein
VFATLVSVAKNHARLLFAAVLVSVLIGAVYTNSRLPPARSSAAVSSGVVISQVYGGGGNSGATFKNDFIELFNPGNAAVDVSSWSVQYASASGTTWQVTNLCGGGTCTVAPGHYYLVQEAQGAGGAGNLPSPDASGSISMSATAGKVALVNGTTALTGSCPLGASVIDFVGYGTANCFEGGSATGAPGNTTAVLRISGGCTDTDNNNSDFAVGTPNPQNSAAPMISCGVSPSPSPTPTPSPTPPCGVERWSVKTGTDADVGMADLSSTQPTTIATMRSWAAPGTIPLNNRVAPYETTVWTINATLVEYKLESDSDYHIVISDNSGNTMVTEIPYPGCVGPASPFAAGIANARAKFDAVFTPTGSFQFANVPVQITGVGMFDFQHGQTGVAPNGIEIHPILDINIGPIIRFSSSSYPGDEGQPRVDISLTRSGDTTTAASVNFATVDAAGLTNCNVINGTASPRCDYTNTLGTATWAAGDATAKTFSVAIVDDSYAEGNETFTVSLSGASGASLGAQSTATVTITDNDAVNGTNPIDSTNFFVRQQYLDFLGREPDPPGLAGWVNTINNCTGDTTQCDRIHVSQLFFQSEEFQQRGYFVYRFYPVAFGRKPDYAEFVPDLARVSGFLDANQLEAAKVAFIAAFMARTAFANTYNPLNNTPYVDMLLNTAGVTLSSRQAMIDGLNNSTLTRAAVLRQIVESTEVSTKYNHQAYAVMEYFGYLRRQPDAFYLDWIAVLDQSNDPRGMVTGFVNSQEYRQRFGP